MGLPNLSDVLGSVASSVPPDRLSFSFDEVQVILFALTSYKERLIEDDSNPDLPVMFGYDSRSFSEICDSVFSRFIHYSFK